MLRSVLRLTLPLAAAAALLSSCGAGEAPPARECRALVWARPESPSTAVLVSGSWDGWGSAEALEPYGEDGWKVRLLKLSPGEYAYRLIEQGAMRLDPYNPLTTFEGEEEASLLVVPDCSDPEVQVDKVEASDRGEATIEGTFLTAGSGSALDPATAVARLEDGAALTVERASPDDGRLVFSARGLAPGKHTATITAKDQEGRPTPPARVAVWVKPAMASWADGVLYQLMIDRFRGDGGLALAPPATPGARAGGTLDGVRAEIDRGTFDELGVTALWLSPVYTNPEGPFPGNDGRSYEAYHGYWPLDSRGVDPRLGGEAALEAVIGAAHRRGIRVLLDFVPNHVYKDNPRYLAHQGDGFFNDGEDQCVCGAPSCGWGDHILTCWFSPYLPDVRWQAPEQMRLAADDARWWMERFDADGVRIDAVPMMPRAASRRMAAALRASQAPRDALFTIGEVYTGGGLPGIDTIRYYLGPDGIDGAFDFPLMWATRDAFATRSGSFTALEGILTESEKKLEGSGAIFGRMLDNHDTSRFISEAAGTAAYNPWESPGPQPTDAAPYLRQEMAFAFVFTLPGLPVLYHGDEVGLAGAGDPDSRRVMPSLEAISPDQAHLRGTVRRLSALRRCLPALRTGARVPLAVTADTYAYLRDQGDGRPVIALFSLRAVATSIELPVGMTPAGDYEDAFTGEKVTIAQGGSIPMPPESFRILLPASSPCPPNF